MENLGNQGDIKLTGTEARRKHLESQPKFDTVEFLPDNVLAIVMEKNIHTYELTSNFRSINIIN